jgi:hypothetical protein
MSQPDVRGPLIPTEDACARALAKDRGEMLRRAAKSFLLNPGSAESMADALAIIMAYRKDRNEVFSTVHTAAFRVCRSTPRRRLTMSNVIEGETVRMARACSASCG